MPVIQCQDAIVAAAKQGVLDHGSYTYSEGPDRMDFLKHPRGYLPVTTDCSGDFTMNYWTAGAPDPNKLGYNGTGYTGTLIAAGRPVTFAHLRTANAVIFGPGTGIHVVTVVQLAASEADVMCVSMGQQGDPELVSLGNLAAVLGSYRFFDYDTTATVPSAPPQRPSGPFRDLRRGSVGPRVRMVQTELRSRHLFPAACLGVYGRQTSWAVGKFQVDSGLVKLDPHGTPLSGTTPYGVVDQATWTMLFGHP